MTSKVSLMIRMIPSLLYLGVVTILLAVGFSGGMFDFWAPMIQFPEDLVSWFVAGVYVVMTSLLLVFGRLIITQLSFQGLGESIPHPDRWENIQFYLILLNVLVPALIGVIYSLDIVNAETFQLLLLGWILLNFLPDLVYFVRWLVVGPPPVTA